MGVASKFELYICVGTPGLKGAERTNPDTSNRQEATVSLYAFEHAFEHLHAQDLRTSAGTSQKHVKFPPCQVGDMSTSRRLNKKMAHPVNM